MTAGHVPAARGDARTIDVEALGDGGDGVARLAGGYVLLVGGALPGERVRVEITSAARKFGRAVLLDVVRPSPDRVPARCPHFLACGSCHLQHLAYPAQLAHKRDRVRRQLAHALGSAPELVPIAAVAAPRDPWRQRTKIALHAVGSGRSLGGAHYRLRSRDLVPIRECPVSDVGGLAAAFTALRAAGVAGAVAWDPATDTGWLRAVVVRAPNGGGDPLVTFVVRRRDHATESRLRRELPRAGVRAAALNVNDGPEPRLLGRRTQPLLGDDLAVATVDGLAYAIGAGSFFQTSAFGAAFLVREVPKLVAAPPGAHVLDLYAGGGLLTLALARAGCRVTAIEENHRAVADARASAARNAISGVAFVAARVERALADLRASGARPWAVVLDPPRAGCGPTVVAGIAALRPERIVHVACDPAALARDVAAFAREGYRLTHVAPLDMFPHAHHVEAVAVLERPQTPSG